MSDFDNFRNCRFWQFQFLMAGTTHLAQKYKTRGKNIKCLKCQILAISAFLYFYFMFYIYWPKVTYLPPQREQHFHFSWNAVFSWLSYVHYYCYYIANRRKTTTEGATFQLKWKCCSLCGWPLSFSYFLIVRDRGQPQREQHFHFNWNVASVAVLCSLLLLICY